MPHVALSKTMKVFRFPVILAVLAAGLLPISTTNAQRYTNIKGSASFNHRDSWPSSPPRFGLDSRTLELEPQAFLLGLGPWSLGQTIVS